ncbi:hypothetical protein K474DRAFT_1413364 [Panus rudis PR-1116 ss-1]|nr:hypothetical protein K474DRAFT_1413364 [Panus rudis PR-1116 ss-1]
MSSRKPTYQYPDSARRDDQRPTLPPIRDILGPVSSRDARPPTGSPQIPFERLRLTDDDSRYAAHQSSSSRSMTPTPRPYHTYPQDPRAVQSYAHNGRSSTDAAQRTPYTYPSASTRQPTMNPGANSGYPYSASHPPVATHPSLTMPGPSNPHGQPAYEPERSSSGQHRYECSYCGKGFTRPSSLKIHINTHTGEKPYTCPFEGCGRSFSVQSNMRRHARVHVRDAEQRESFVNDDESEEEIPEPSSHPSSSSRAHGSSR